MVRKMVRNSAKGMVAQMPLMSSKAGSINKLIPTKIKVLKIDNKADNFPLFRAVKKVDPKALMPIKINPATNILVPTNAIS
jgi:hypothetical protein